MVGIFLLIFPVWNVFTKQQTASDISYTILLVLVAVVEEIFFRGFLYDMLSKWSQKGYIFLSAFLFGAFHLVNLFEGYPLDYVMIQTLCAFMAGIGYAWVTVKTQSIIPGMVAHILTNISA